VASDVHSLTIGPDGPILLQDHYLIEQMANFNRERIPERQPHAKGSGAFGYFEVTQDVSRYTRAAVFQPGAKTETLIRFSTVAGERGSPDTWRDRAGSCCGSTPARATWTSSATTPRSSSCVTR
jgi:catalase